MYINKQVKSLNMMAGIVTLEVCSEQLEQSGIKLKFRNKMGADMVVSKWVFLQFYFPNFWRIVE